MSIYLSEASRQVGLDVSGNKSPTCASTLLTGHIQSLDIQESTVREWRSDFNQQ